MPPRRRRYGEGSVTQLADGRWRGTIRTGWLPSGNYRTKSVSGPTEAIAHRKLDLLIAEIRINGQSDARAGATVKTWADEWLDIKEGKVRPETFKGYRTATRRWIVPTIGHRRLADLTPGDMRKVGKAVTDAGRSSTTAHLQTVILKMMLRDAINEGHPVPHRVLMVQAPSIATNNRAALTPEHSAAILHVIANRPDRARWLLALFYGVRQGEALGLTWPCVDFEQGTIEIRWQLSNLPWRDRKAKILRVPPDLEHIQLAGTACLTPPKSSAGFRMLPMPPVIADAFHATERIGTLGLVFPRPDGLPQDPHDDLATWHQIQDLADVRHPTGRHYNTHELRHTAATSMMRLGIDSKTQVQLMGHTSITTTDIYRHADLATMREALTRATAELPR